MTPDDFEIVLVAQLLSIWRLAADQSQTRNAAPLLVNRDDGLDLT
jgi:hypothetical protein